MGSVKPAGTGAPTTAPPPPRGRIAKSPYTALSLPEVFVRLIHPVASMLMFAALVAFSSRVNALEESQQTALDRYVAAPDASYRYELVKTVDGEGYRFIVLDLTSQTWLTDQEVDRPLWRHWLVIAQPKAIRSTTGMLFIGGGANGRPAPTRLDAKLVQIALATGSVVAELRNVPNQAL